MRLDDFRARRNAETEDRNERARAAVKAFRAMQHGLTGYARAITGNPKVRVEVTGAEPHTDGQIIYYRPPIRLGDKTPHDTSRCDKRDAQTGLQTCPACSIREEVLVNVYHEIAHIAFGTFAPTSEKDRSDALARGVAEWGSKYATEIEKRINAAPPQIRGTYLGLASLISPFLPSLLNSLEDARVDTAMFESRKGTKKMLTADVYSLFRDGIEGGDGKIRMWAEADLNSQAAIGCYLIAAGFDKWEDYLHEKVVADLADPKLRELLATVAHGDSMAATYASSFPVLERLRDFGYMRLPEEQEEPEPTPPLDEGGDEEQKDEPDQTEPDDNEQESGDDDGDSKGGDDPQGGEGEAGSGDQESEGGAGEGESPDPEPSDEPADGPGESGDGDGEAQPYEEGGDQSGDSDVQSESGSAGEDSGDDSSDSGSGEPDDSVGDGAEGDASDEHDSAKASEADGSSSGDDSPREAEDDGRDNSGRVAPEGETEQADGTAAGDGDGSGEHGGAEPGAAGEGSGEAAEEVDAGADHPAEADEVPDQRHDEAAGSGAEGGDTSEPSGEQSADRQDRHGEPAQDEGADSFVDGERGDGDEGEQDARLASVLESGADEGEGGTPVPDWGSPTDVEQTLSAVHEAHHDPAEHAEPDRITGDQKAIAVAVMQGAYFETPSAHVSEVHEFRDGEGPAWDLREHLKLEDQIMLGIECDVDVPESILGPSLLKLRRIFDDNKTAAVERHRRSGKVDAKVLGRRAWSGDDRLFQKKRVPGKKDYSVLIAIDISSSNLGDNLALVKRAAFAQAELMSRLGVEFSVVAHHCGVEGKLQERSFTMELYHIKDWNQPWDDKAQERLSSIGAVSGNLDGHALEYCRKQLDRVDTTDRILLYYTDGKMPAANKEEELEILQREIRTCRRKGYTLLGVGIRTNSPVRHGLDTVQVDTDEDLKAVVEHLGRRLANPAR